MKLCFGTALSVLLVLTAPGCAPSEPTVRPEENRLLEELMESYVSERFAFYPVEATLAGLPGNDDRLGSYTEIDVERRIAWLTDFHYRLMGVRLTDLGRPAYLDALWLTSLVKSEIFDLSERRSWERTAAFYGERILVGLVSLVAAEDLGERFGALLGRLDQVVQLTSQARENLGPVDTVWLEDGLASLDACRSLLRELPGLVEGRLPEANTVAFSESQRNAQSAVEELASLLPVIQFGPNPTGFVSGRDALERYFRNAHLSDWPLDELRGRVADSLQAEVHELTSLALASFPNFALRELVAQPPENAPEAFVVAAQARVRARTGTASPAAPGPFPVRLTPPYFPVRDPVTLWRSRALEPKRGAFLMVRTEWPHGPPSAAALELSTLREVGGRARQHRYQAESASLLRRVFASASTEAGWLARFERASVEAGTLPEGDAIRVARHARRILELVRLGATIDIHALGVPLHEAERRFEESAFLTPLAARAEARRVAVSLEGATPGLGALLVEDLVSDYRKRYPLETPAQIDQKLLESGSLPVRLIRFDLLEPASGPFPD